MYKEYFEITNPKTDWSKNNIYDLRIIYSFRIMWIFIDNSILKNVYIKFVFKNIPKQQINWLILYANR